MYLRPENLSSSCASLALTASCGCHPNLALPEAAGGVNVELSHVLQALMQWGERAGPSEMQTVLASLLGLPQQAAAMLQHQAPASVQKPHQQAGLKMAGSSAGTFSIQNCTGTDSNTGAAACQECLPSRAYVASDSHLQPPAHTGRRAQCIQDHSCMCYVAKHVFEWKLPAHWWCCVQQVLLDSIQPAPQLRGLCLVQTGSGVGWSTPSPSPTLQSFSCMPPARRQLRHHPLPASKLRSVLTATP